MDQNQALSLICQARDPFDPRLTCDAMKSGGIRCEVREPHTTHEIGQHTILHRRAGNGYSCQYVDECPDPGMLTPFTAFNPWSS